MKQGTRNRQKHRGRPILAMVLLLSLCLSVVAPTSSIQAYAVTQEEGVVTSLAASKELAVSWLKEQVLLAGEEAAKAELLEGTLPNDICSIIAVLTMLGEECISDIPKEWAETHEEKNIDELVHLYLATKEDVLLETAMSQQNLDGGFGLTKAYTSDIYDTYLVAMADAYQRMMSEKLEDAADDNTSDDDMDSVMDSESEDSAATGYDIEKALGYLMAHQNEDGGFGYHETDTSRPKLTAEIGIMLQAYEADVTYEKIDEYCKAQFTGKLEAESFSSQAAIARYLYQRNQTEAVSAIETALLEIQQENGSIYDNVLDTLQYVLLIEAMEAYYEIKLDVSKVDTVADTYVLEAGKASEVALATSVRYTINHPVDAVVRYTLLETGEVIQTKEESITLSSEEEAATIDSMISFVPEAEGSYVLRTEVVVGDEAAETIYGTHEITFAVEVIEEKELVLEVSKNEETENALDLSWTDISTEDDRYQYRFYRKMGDGNWESRSIWNGEEQVKVLNIYPAEAGKAYLTDWMETTISETGDPAGKGLFDIETVYIDDFNENPERYLLDETGNYQYDVLVFGIYDSNNLKDISLLAYEATMDYIESGRGVLFGHDTVCHEYYRKNFSLFADVLGITTKKSYTPYFATRVNIVKQGMLTAYPWELSGTLQIPKTHISGQYVGGSLASKVWVEMGSGHETDSTTGAKTNGYLITNENVAMIQTGHSIGQATDDERKLIANTMFYLKQLTENTKVTDHDFRDLESPDVSDISELSEEDTITLKAEDKGTDYSYYVEASEAGDIRTSNEVTATAISGMEGFIVAVTEGKEAEEILTYDEEGNLLNEVLASEDGTITYTFENLKVGETVYVHVYAVDQAGNISDVQTKAVTKEEAATEEPTTEEPTTEEPTTEEPATEEPTTEEDTEELQDYFDLPYGMVATDSSLVLSCNEANIMGDIYGKSNIQFQGSILNLDGTASSAGAISASGWKIHILKKQEYITPLVLTDFREQIRKDMESAEPLDEIVSYNSTEITIPTICKKTTGAWCNDVRILASLLSEGGISLNANTITIGEDTPVVLCSETGNISIQATKVTGTGLIYAPEGIVTINASEFTFKGIIIAKEIRVQAGYVNQTALYETEE